MHLPVISFFIITLYAPSSNALLSFLYYNSFLEQSMHLSASFSRALLSSSIKFKLIDVSNSYVPFVYDRTTLSMMHIPFHTYSNPCNSHFES